MIGVGTVGRNFSQNKFDGVLGEELDRLWAAIKQDQIVSSPSVQANRTPSGTILNGAPKKAGGAVKMPLEENLSGQRWLIDGNHTMDTFPHIVKVKSLDGSRSMRALGVPLDHHNMSTAAPIQMVSVPYQHQPLATVLWPQRVKMIEVPSTYPVFEWPNSSSTLPVQYQGSTYNMFWLFEDGYAAEWYEPYPGGYRTVVYQDGDFAFLEKLALPFTDQAGRIDYYVRQVQSSYSGVPYIHRWRVASIT